MQRPNHLVLPDYLRHSEDNTQPRHTVRFLYRDALMAFRTLPVYEELKASTYVDVEYDCVDEEMWSSLAVVSWRWHSPPPKADSSGFSTMSSTQLDHLTSIVGSLPQQILYVWIDYSCVPQTQGPCMSEIIRSRLYYAKAGKMLVLPALVKLPESNSLQPLIWEAKETVSKLSGSEAMYFPAEIKAVTRALSRQGTNPVLAYRDYFSRAWTLAERMARGFRQEKLKDWMPLELWISVVAGIMWATLRGEQVDNFPWDMLPSAQSMLMRTCLDRLRQWAKAAQPDPRRMSRTTAVLFLEAYRSWEAPLTLVEPTPLWLRTYITKQAMVQYIASDWRDTIWAIYGFFDGTTRKYEDTAEVVQMMCLICDVDFAATQWCLQGKITESSLPGGGQSIASAVEAVRKQKTLLITRKPRAFRSMMSLRARSERLLADGDASSQEGLVLQLREVLVSLQMPATGWEECEVRRQMLTGLQHAMRQAPDSREVQKLSCQGLLKILADKASCERAGELKVVDDMYTIVVKHSRDKELLLLSCAVLNSLIVSPLVFEASSVSTQAMLRALQEVINNRCDSIELLEGVCTCLCLLTEQSSSVQVAFHSLGMLTDVLIIMELSDMTASVLGAACRLISSVMRGGGPQQSELDQVIETRSFNRVIEATIAAMERFPQDPELQRAGLQAINCTTLHALEYRDELCEVLCLGAVKNTMVNHMSSSEVVRLGCAVTETACAASFGLQDAINTGIISVIHTALAKWPKNLPIVKHSSLALAQLLKNPEIRQQAVDLGLVSTLKSIMMDAGPEIEDAAYRTLALLA